MIRNVTRTLLAALVLTATAAHAKGLLLSSDALPATMRAGFAEQIAAAKKANPQAFAKVNAVLAKADALDLRKRGRIAAISPMLKPLGADALWPLVSAIAFDAEGAPLRPSAKLALDVGVIEAAGALRDDRLAPLWTALLDGHEQRFDVVRAAAAALGKLDSDAAAKTLVSLTRTDDVRRSAVLASMGECRRQVVARALAEVLDAHPDPLTAKTVARSLGEVGNAWAWQTPAVKARWEEGAVRSTAAEALVRASVAYDGEVRQAASNALMVVNAPSTQTLIATAQKSATDEQRQALDGLAQRFAKNPAR